MKMSTDGNYGKQLFNWNDNKEALDSAITAIGGLKEFMKSKLPKDGQLFVEFLKNNTLLATVTRTILYQKLMKMSRDGKLQNQIGKQLFNWNDNKEALDSAIIAIGGLKEFTKSELPKNGQLFQAFLKNNTLPATVTRTMLYSKLLKLKFSDLR